MKPSGERGTSGITSFVQQSHTLTDTACNLHSVPGIGPVASAMRLAEMPELGAVSGEQAAALSLLEPIANDSGSLRGKRAIAGGRRALRHVLS
ncbi:transposase [uncultured Mameliella sp.]|uniref:transposase n=1 Tax=uncultured Mameliella sp. TaxID=1447087 RepID=UPI00345C5828